MGAVPATPAPARGQVRERWVKRSLRLGVLAALLGIWQLAGDDSVQLAAPTFTRTLAALTDLAASGALLGALVESNTAMVLGYVLAIVVGLPLGVLMGSVPVMERVVQPYLTMLLTLPMIAVLPVIQTIFGLGLGSRTMVVFLFAFVYVAVNTTVGVRGVDVQLREMARSFGASRRQLLREVVLPAAVPAIMAGARLALGRAIVGMVVAELFLVSDGVGSLIAYYRGQFDAGPVVALAVTLVLEGVALTAVARRVEQRLGRR